MAYTENQKTHSKKNRNKPDQDFPGGPVEESVFNARDASSIPGQRTKIPHAAGQLSPRATMKRPHMPQVRPNAAKKLIN